MTKATMLKTLGTALSVVLAGLAVQFHSNPLAAELLPALSTLLVGWLHLPQPGTAKAP